MATAKTKTTKEAATKAPAKPAAATSTKPAKTDKGKKEEAGPIGVSPSASTRPFLAGKLLAEVGLQHGITPELVAKLDDMVEATGSRSKRNEREAKFCLGNAWHTLAGYEAAKS